MPCASYFVNPAGKVRPIRNLRPVLDYARKCCVDTVEVRPLPEGRAKLTVRYVDYSYACVEFASYQVCWEFASSSRRSWRDRYITLCNEDD